MTATDSTFRAPIPGQSLTHKMGSLPHEKPPKFVNPNEALDYIWKMLNQKEALKQIWNCMEQHITVWHIARALLFKLALEGTIQLNLAMVIAPTVGKMIETIGRAKGVDVKMAPKFRSKTFDSMTDQNLNAKLGRGDNPTPVPVSALKSTLMPSAEEVTQGVAAISGKKQSEKGMLDRYKEQPNG